MATKNQEKQGQGLGLEALGNLSDLLKVDDASAGGVIELALDVIDEDPNQPRTADNPGFTEDSIAEIGSTIKQRGVKSPISVRDNPEAPGRYIINHGARRFRGSKWAGKTTIPAFVDNDYDERDQVIENIQRNELTAKEIAAFIGRELKRGKKKKEIAQDLGRTAAFVSQHVTLLDLAAPIQQAMDAGRVSDLTAINELATIYSKEPAEVTQWLSNQDQEITRGSVKMFRDYLDQRGSTGTDDEADGAPEEQQEPESQAEKKKEKAEDDPEKLKKAIVQIEHDDRPARLILNRRPTVPGNCWIKYDDDGSEADVMLRTVTVIEIVEG